MLERRRIARVLVSALVVAASLGLATATSSQSVVPTSAALLGGALAAERDSRFDAAIDELYRLVVEHPRSNEALRGRLRLAQLLALAGELNAALLQCQTVTNITSVGDPERAEAVAISATLVRQLRGQSARRSYFPSVSSSTLRGLDRFDEPTALIVGAEGALVLSDRGKKRIYGISANSISTLAVANDPQAATLLRDGTLAVADKRGLLLGSSRSTLSATWDGRARELDNVRAMAENSRGELFVVDGDYDGLLKCGSTTATCEPWGIRDKARTVKVGLADYVYVLDDGDPIVRVFNTNGQQMATIGPQIGAGRLRRVRDIALDQAYGVYLLDDDSKTVHVARLALGADGRLRAQAIAAVRIPESGQNALERPAALAVAPDGTVMVVGRPSLNLLKLQ